MSSEHYVVLHTGQKMPLVGLGTWKSEAGQVSNEFAVWENKVYQNSNSLAFNTVVGHESTGCILFEGTLD